MVWGISNMGSRNLFAAAIAGFLLAGGRLRPAITDLRGAVIE
jgi:hypothetical protein